MRRVLTGGTLAFALSAAACAPSVSVSLPGGAGRVEPAVEGWFDDARRHCSTVGSWTAELALAGRLRGQRVAGRALAGSTREGSLRLEALAPFGAPVLVLVVHGEDASLLLPRESRVLRAAPAADVLDALAGLPMSGADLHALLTGCAVASPVVGAGHLHDGGWASLDLGGGRTAYLKHGPNGWRLEAARLGGLTVGYGNYAAMSPQELRLVSAGDASARLQLRLRLAQVEENVTLGPDAFLLDVPPDALPLSLDELRSRGLALGDR